MVCSIRLLDRMGSISITPRSAPFPTTTGDIVHIRILGRSIVYVNTAEAAIDLFSKRSTIYSDRPRLPLLNEMCAVFVFSDRPGVMFDADSNVHARRTPKRSSLIHHQLSHQDGYGMELRIYAVRREMATISKSLQQQVRLNDRTGIQQYSRRKRA